MSIYDSKHSFYESRHSMIGESRVNCWGLHKIGQYVFNITRSLLLNSLIRHDFYDLFSFHLLIGTYTDGSFATFRLPNIQISTFTKSLSMSLCLAVAKRLGDILFS